MEVTGKDIEEFAETAETGALRRYALITAQIMSKTQLKALQRYFARPIVLTVPEAKATPQGKGMAINEAGDMDEDEDGDEAEAAGDEDSDDVEALLAEAQEQIAPPTMPPARPAQDFGFGGDTPRPRGRPPVSREQAEKEFEEIVRRRKAATQ